MAQSKSMSTFVAHRIQLFYKKKKGVMIVEK